MLRRFAANGDANVAITFSILIFPTIFALGMALDYTLKCRRESQLNAAVDAAVIAALTPAMMTKDVSVATQNAQNVFSATANNLPGLAAPPVLTLNVTSNGLVRTATASYTAASVNQFATLLGSAAWAIQGNSTATASGAPNINFYLLLDDSPSMAIAGTQDGINQMVANTAQQGGCGFACHQSDPAADNLGNPGGEDNYTLASNLGVTLRIDLVRQALSDLVTQATQAQTTYNTTYKMAIYTFDFALNTIYAPSGQPSANLAGAGSQATLDNIQMPVWYRNGWRTSSDEDNDTGTDFASALQNLNVIMPNPGGGTNASGDTPQEAVLIVTDGVEDKQVPSASACTETIVTFGNPTHYRCQQPVDISWCTAVKQRGILVAVLYTEYLPLTSNGWYNTYLAPFNSPTAATGAVAKQLQACASPGLFVDVASGGDISQGLGALFQLSVNSVRLTK